MTIFGAEVEKWEELLSVCPGCERILGGDASVCKICLVVVVEMQFCAPLSCFLCLKNKTKKIMQAPIMTKGHHRDQRVCFSSTVTGDNQGSTSAHAHSHYSQVRSYGTVRSYCTFMISLIRKSKGHKIGVKNEKREQGR